MFLEQTVHSLLYSREMTMVQISERHQQGALDISDKIMLRIEIERLEKLLKPSNNGHGHQSRAAQMYGSRLANVRQMLGEIERNEK